MIVLRALSFDDGPHVVDRWYSDHVKDEELLAELDALMLYLRQQNREGWTRPRYDTLRDTGGAGAIHFRVRRVEQRWLGFFGPSRNEFTFLIFATKTNRYDPRNAIDSVIARRDLVVANPNRSVVIKGRWCQ